MSDSDKHEDKHDQEHLNNDKPSLHHVSIQETDEAIGNDPVVTGHARAHDPPTIASPKAAALPCPENIRTLAVALVHISPSLNPYQLKIYGLVVSTQGVLLQSIEKLEDFKNVFYLLEKKMPAKAVSITMESLNSLGIDTRPLEPFEDEVFVIHDHYHTHFVLTLGVILASMSEEAYMSFMELARREYFRNVHPDNLKDPAKLVGKLLGDGTTEEKDLHNYFKWIPLAGYRSQLKMLKEFCERHDFAYPGNHSTPPIPPPPISSSHPPSATLPPDVSLDGNHRGDINNGTFHHFNNTRGGGDSHEDLTTQKDDETDRTDPPHWDFEPHPQEEEQGKIAKIVVPTSGNVSQALPPTGVRGRDDTHSERKSLSDTVPDYGSITRNIHAKSLPINTPPPTQNGDLPTHDRPPPTPDRPDTPPPTQNRDSPTRPQIITDPFTTTHRRKKKRRRAACNTVVIFAIIALVLYSLGSLVAWLVYSDNHGLLYFGLDSVTKYVGGSVISLLGCFNSAYTKRVVVTRERDGDDYQASLLLIKEPELFGNVRKNTLSCFSLNVDTGNHNQALNCYLGDRPIHATEEGGIVSYNMTAVCNETSPSSCQYALYQFISIEEYWKYTDGYENIVPERFQQSKVLTAKSFETSQQVDFKLLEGFNYFAVYVPKGVELANVTITGYYTYYNISLPLPEQCSIDSSTDHCSVPINDHNTIPAIGHEQVMCVLAMSHVDADHINSYPVTVAPHNFSINELSLGMMILWIIFTCLLVVTFISIMYCCRNKYHTSASEAAELLVRKGSNS